jgi:hypothetical protein
MRVYAVGASARTLSVARLKRNWNPKAAALGAESNPLPQATSVILNLQGERGS